jgi:signal transduction histidine kinase
MRSKYNKPGGRIRLAARVVNCAGEMIVGNAGDGIPKERTAQLFERFYQARGDERAVSHVLEVRALVRQTITAVYTARKVTVA